MNPKYRAIRDLRYPHYWTVEKRTWFGWRPFHGGVSQDDAQRILNQLVSPDFLYPETPQRELK